jgi:hypothetical protein
VELGDLRYEGEAATITVAFKKPKHSTLTGVRQQFNKAHNGIRSIAERGNPCWSSSISTMPTAHDDSQ